MSGDSSSTATKLDLSTYPPIFVSPTHFEIDDLHELEDEIVGAGGALTYDLEEARVVISKVTRKPRILFDLKANGLWTEEVKTANDAPVNDEASTAGVPLAKRPKLDHERRQETGNVQAIVIDDSSTASDTDEQPRVKSSNHGSSAAKQREAMPAPRVIKATVKSSDATILKVVKPEWINDSLAAGKPLALDGFLTYQGRRVDRKDLPTTPVPAKHSIAHKKKITAATHTAPALQKVPMRSADILERAKDDAPSHTAHPDRFGKRKFGHQVASSVGASWEAGQGKGSQHAHLLHTTTSENDQGVSSDLPEPPEWVKAGIKYACQRVTLRCNPNDPFISLLKQIKLARLLTNDEIGVRAYSTSIASLAAYPHKISNPREILALPGCDAKLANLYVEWKNTGKLQAVEDINADEDLKILRLFYDIWGVGAITAREFYYDKGWRDMDDIVEYGWNTLSRVQQIGVKYYEEFLDPIPREEVSQIARLIHQHACKVRDKNIQSLLVGGYRRGKEACGDVDIIVSHPDEKQTLQLVKDIVASLEQEDWITHTLLLSLHNTNRDQQTLPFRGGAAGGHGFDTLDKALVVWQDPNWPTKEADLAANPKAKNPNIHRRVDIIISPWRTVGCAVAGWTSGTTFQRDLRRYAKAAKGWKFDSSGVRERGNGEVVDLEGFYAYRGGIGEGRAKTMEEAEKRVFEGMGLVYREPWERCTG